MRGTWKFAADTGGTFTDCLALAPDGMRHRAKVLSSSTLRGRVVAVESPRRFRVESTWSVPDGFFTGCRFRPLDAAGDAIKVADSRADGTVTLASDWPGELTEGLPVGFHSPEPAPILAARLITGTPHGRELPPMDLRLATTRGTNALLEEKGAPLAFFVTHGHGDLLRIGNQQRPDLFALDVRRPAPLHREVVEVPGRLAADGTELEPLDLDALREPVARLLAGGIRTAAIALLHSTREPAHERRLAAFLREVGFENVSASSELAARIKILPRAETAVVDAYLADVMTAYLDANAAPLRGGRLRVMTSAGGLVTRAAYRPKDSLLSGPAGGLVGAAEAARRAGEGRLLAFDMGGTSTDVARFDGEFEVAGEHRVGRARLVAPAVKIESVAAGGGSICGFNGRALTVGPESAGAHPGPACYGAGGPLTVTDVNLLLGRLDPAQFSIPVYPERARERLDELARSIAEATGEKRLPDAELLDGFTAIANEHMAEAIRKISVREGYDCADYALVAFGGAGGLHACAIAEALGVTRVLHAADSGVLSAYGLTRAVVERFAERQILTPLDEAVATLPALLDELATEALAGLTDEGVAEDERTLRSRQVELRLRGQEASLAVEAGDKVSADKLAAAFEERYRALYGYWPAGRMIEVVGARVQAVSRVEPEEAETFPESGAPLSAAQEGAIAIHPRDTLRPGVRVAGPAIVQDHFSTVFIAPGWEAATGTQGTLRLARTTRPDPASVATEASDVIARELFTRRFAGLVEEMGGQLERTALSTNVKERLDFSCGLLDARGELLVNAPHIPVHLGALGECVRQVARRLAMNPGDTVVTNHPACGGSHLPDITLITPVHVDGPDGAPLLLGYVANRAHHAEVGGITPGSMPAHAKTLAEEGVVLAPMHLIRGGEADWDGVRARLTGALHPSRAPDDNLADLHAQLAANQRGAALLRKLAEREGVERVQRFMGELSDHAAEVMARRLTDWEGRTFEAVEKLDDGTPLAVRGHVRGGRLTLDFTGTGATHPGNFNATPAITASAIMYVLRLTLDEAVPLNEGLMRDVELVLPPDCLLNPTFPEAPAQCPAVVGGNVETSQRLVDTLVRALGLAACAQGTMNNLIFGNARASYYETICGGMGAGEGFPGADAVQVHMTNTAITDPEILEHRFPVRLERFAIRRGSGGTGAQRGGDGAVRELVFTEAVTVSMLTQHRVEEPYGMAGGGPGARGRQRVVRADGTVEELKPSDQAELQPGDRLIVETPGGGAWGV